MLRQPLQPAFEMRIHFCHTHFPSAGSACLSQEEETHTETHTGGYTQQASCEGGRLKATVTLSNEAKKTHSYPANMQPNMPFLHLS